MSYTLNEAAKATGKSKTTIHRALKSGKVSAVKRDNGAYAIEPAELHRVFPPVPAERNEERSSRNDEEHLRNDQGTLRIQLEYAVVPQSSCSGCPRRDSLDCAEPSE